jgi:hypothetical protein
LQVLKITKLPNYQIEEEPGRRTMLAVRILESGDHEGSGIGKEDL